MTYLELCKKVAIESGVSSTNPTSVKNQTGILAKIITWVADADLTINTLYNQWQYLYASASFSFIANKKEYLAGDLGINTTSTLESEQVDAITIDGKPLAALTWLDFVREVNRTSKKNEQGQPKAYTVKPDGNIVFYPMPDASLSAAVDFYKTPTRLIENTDVSLLPVKYQLLIVWQALMYYGLEEGDQDIFVMAQRQYDELFDRLTKAYLPRINMGRSFL